eukprot:Gb_21742 [translate_table: standard]
MSQFGNGCNENGSISGDPILQFSTGLEEIRKETLVHDASTGQGTMKEDNLSAACNNGELDKEWQQNLELLMEGQHESKAACEEKSVTGDKRRNGMVPNNHFTQSKSTKSGATQIHNTRLPQDLTTCTKPQVAMRSNRDTTLMSKKGNEADTHCIMNQDY